MNKQQDTFNREQSFLSDLSDLLEAHKVAISSFEKSGKGDSEVVFQFSGTEDGIQHNLHTGRFHNTEYDMRGLGERNTMIKTEPAFI